MPAIVEPVPDCFLLDTDQKLSRSAMQAALNCGAKGLIRYIGLGMNPGAEDIDAEELSDAMFMGLGVMLVQHVRFEGWHPSALMGETDGTVACRHAKAAGYLEGASLWDDLEGILGTGQETVAYANAKFSEVEKQGFLQGEYVGFQVPLDGHQLFSNLHARSYWKSLSNVPEVVTRGYCMLQMGGIVLGGVDYDLDFHQADKLGGRAMWMRGA
jgi:hypothetical protein